MPQWIINIPKLSVLIMSPEPNPFLHDVLKKHYKIHNRYNNGSAF